ncbi:MAG TPA: UDP-N-acetylglucosamine 2-epimerase (non-hydrolyzing) [Thermoleophilia bacterium]|nr:UDP-N-acetylglucosamine 2-epimerase (non-hydrolyzing) [Thermoleophilia bacterium]
MARRCVVVAFGTRPEAIKLAPVIRRLRERDVLDVRVLVTGQHREMLDQVLRLFDIAPDADLDVMLPRQLLDQLTCRVLSGIAPVLDELAPDAVIVQGDTTTTFVAALAAFYRGVPVAHVEAGLRTGTPDCPFPEEMNRRLTTRLATWHFAATIGAQANLLAEGVSADSISLTGNTVIDALFEALEVPFVFPPGRLADALAGDMRIVLVTAHRRENWGEPIRDICRALRRLVEVNEDIVIVFSVHKNPVVREAVDTALRGVERVMLLDPLEYLPFVHLMEASTLVLSDSGGMQEEAPSLGKPVLVLRQDTERPEAVECGVAKVVGTDPERIFTEASSLLGDAAAYCQMARASNPFGDGHAAERIAGVLESRLS